MRLTLDQIQPITFGALKVQQTTDSISFHRFPKKLYDFYQQTTQATVRSQCPSGVRLRFNSNTRSLKIGLKYGDWAREFFQQSLFVDSELTEVFGPTRHQQDWQGQIFEQCKDTTHFFEIWLPHLCVNTLSLLEIDDGCDISIPAKPKLKWLAYGDSITQGMTVCLPQDSYTALCAKKIGADFLSVSIGGAILDAELADEPIDYQWDLATIAYGINDFRNMIPPEDLYNNAIKLIDLLTSIRPDKPILVITPIPVIDNPVHTMTGCHLDAYRSALIAATQNYDSADFVDGPKLVPAETKYFADIRCIFFRSFCT